MIIAYGGTALVVLLGGLAAWRGGWAEKSAVSVVLVAWFATPIIQTRFAPGLPLVFLDAGQAIILFAISFFSRRIWSLLISACAGAGVITDLLGLFVPHTIRMLWAYVVAAQVLDGVFVALCFAVALWESEYLRTKPGQARRRDA